MSEYGSVMSGHLNMNITVTSGNFTQDICYIAGHSSRSTGDVRVWVCNGWQPEHEYHCNARKLYPGYLLHCSTVLGLQSMSEYGSVMSGNLNMNITVTSGNFTQDICYITGHSCRSTGDI